MKEETIGKIIVSLLVIGAIFGAMQVFKALEQQQVISIEKRNAAYEDCKTRTADVEWCVKIIKPIF